MAFDMSNSWVMLVPSSGLLLLSVAFCCSAAELVTIDINSARDLLNAGYIFLDVRTVEEFEQGHVNAEKIINIPYLFHTRKGAVKNPLFLKQVSSVCHKEDHIIVGCQIGIRSLSAAADLLADGFEDVKNMKGGYVEWVKSGFPVIEPAAREIRLHFPDWVPCKS